MVHIHLPDHYFSGEQKGVVNFSKLTENLKENDGLAFKMPLPKYKKARVLAQNSRKPPIGSELVITKARYQLGVLQLLLTTESNNKGKHFSFWYPIDDPNTEVNKVLKTIWSRKKIRTCGSPLKFERCFNDARWKPSAVPEKGTDG